MTFQYNSTVGIVIDGKIVETFLYKRTTPICDKLLSLYVIANKGYEANSFTLIKMGS